MHRATKIVIKASALAAITLIASATAAHASVTDGGVGFVGKGDVQTALSWNNQALQDNADKLAFLRQVDGDRAVRLAVILRLAVRINRGRDGAPNPELRMHDKTLVLGFASGFLESSPMTRADLEEEQELLKSAGIEIAFK